MYREITRSIEVQVEPAFLPEESARAGQFIFAYRVSVRNLGEARVQLVDRHWIIQDGRGQVHEVQGEGVIGEQPWIEPGAAHVYESYCPLPTPTGNMRGSYGMRLEDGSGFRARIPLFFLRDLRPGAGGESVH
jgi:ApaG protein